MGRFRKLETLTDYQRALKQKFGLGEHTNYKPWLRVQDVKSYGHSAKIDGLKTKRVHHLFSEHESCFFYLAEFCDSVVDIREQFPLLPLTLSVKIAKILDVKHPAHPQSKELSLMTTDFLLTRTDGNRVWYEAVAVKPADQLSDTRTAEKLDIERLWWQLQGIPFHLFVMTEQNKIQSKNIQWFSAPYRQGRQFNNYIVTQAKLCISAGISLVADLCDNFVRELQVETDEALVLLKILLATKQIKADLNSPIADTGIVNIINVVDHETERQDAS